MKYDVDYFIAKFEAIPEDKWCMGSYRNIKDESQRCALGHCDHTKLESEAECLHQLFCKYDLNVAPINDGLKTIKTMFPQPTPKQRILAALYDIREKELSEANLKAATIIVNTETKIYENT